MKLDIEIFKKLLNESSKDLDFEEVTVGLSEEQYENLQELDEYDLIIESIVNEVISRLKLRTAFIKASLEND